MRSIDRRSSRAQDVHLSERVHFETICWFRETYHDGSPGSSRLNPSIETDLAPSSNSSKTRMWHCYCVSNPQDDNHECSDKEFRTTQPHEVLAIPPAARRCRGPQSVCAGLILDGQDPIPASRSVGISNLPRQMDIGIRIRSQNDPGP